METSFSWLTSPFKIKDKNLNEEYRLSNKQIFFVILLTIFLSSILGFLIFTPLLMPIFFFLLCSYFKRGTLKKLKENQSSKNEVFEKTLNEIKAVFYGKTCKVDLKNVYLNSTDETQQVGPFLISKEGRNCYIFKLNIEEESSMRSLKNKDSFYPIDLGVFTENDFLSILNKVSEFISNEFIKEGKTLFSYGEGLSERRIEISKVEIMDKYTLKIIFKEEG